MTYDNLVKKEMLLWEKKMLKNPNMTNLLAKGFQNKVNSMVPNKVHHIITEGIKKTVKLVLFGSELMTNKPLKGAPLSLREKKVLEKTDHYKTIAIASGWGTGAGGIMLGMADFPILLSIKVKYLFEVASLYGFDVKNYKERVFILYVFQLAFSSQQSRQKVYKIIENWEQYAKSLPEKEDFFDWRSFQQEYRDYIDFAKMLQLVPGIGAVVGAYANNKLMKQLANVAMQAYRLRYFDSPFR
ncbi:MAG: ABC transporter-associated protein EcsC [Firmicutes bacterium HGW-Firmicutes-7]|nr:MAG: ABC transporter-associated protein EcsC [Firmicutes bacterium HGW-Firmicutes-7]